MSSMYAISKVGDGECALYLSSLCEAIKVGWEGATSCYLILAQL